MRNLSKQLRLQSNLLSPVFVISHCEIVELSGESGTDDGGDGLKPEGSYEFEMDDKLLAFPVLGIKRSATLSVHFVMQKMA